VLSLAVSVDVVDPLIVAGPVIVAVHVHRNDTVIVIRPVDGSCAPTVLMVVIDP
jgi:hypothetical protein